MPLHLRIAILGGIGLLILGATLLMLGRGNAMLIDLSAGAAALLCL
jgi:hypothetical protein